MFKHNKFFLFFLCMLLSTSCIFADDGVSDVIESIPVDESSSTPIVVDITQLLTPNTKGTEEDPQVVVVDEMQLVNMTQSLQKVSASDATGFKAILLQLLGDYETVVTDYEYRNNNNTYMSHSIAIEQDYAWIASAAIFALLIYCTFRSIGGILCRI